MKWNNTILVHWYYNFNETYFKWIQCNKCNENWVNKLNAFLNSILIFLYYLSVYLLPYFNDARKTRVFINNLSVLSIPLQFNSNCIIFHHFIMLLIDHNMIIAIIFNNSIFCFSLTKSMDQLNWIDVM